jgi:hypothetical protein
MVDLIFRNNGPWGTGKGARLTSLEGDGNFYALKQAVEDALTNPLQPLQIADIQVVGNQMTIILSDFSTTFGPFTLPVATFSWQGPWEPSTNYSQYDLIVANEGMFLVLQDHTSGFTFDPDASNTNGPFYALIFPFPNIYQFGFFFPGKPGNGIDVDRPVFQHLFKREVILPAALVGSGGRLNDAPLDLLTLDIQKNGVSIGSINFPEYVTEAQFTFAADVTFTIDDMISVIRPAVLDDLARDLTVTFNGTLITLS